MKTLMFRPQRTEGIAFALLFYKIHGPFDPLPTTYSKLPDVLEHNPNATDVTLEHFLPSRQYMNADHIPSITLYPDLWNFSKYPPESLPPNISLHHVPGVQAFDLLSREHFEQHPAWVFRLLEEGPNGALGTWIWLQVHAANSLEHCDFFGSLLTRLEDGDGMEEADRLHASNLTVLSEALTACEEMHFQHLNGFGVNLPKYLLLWGGEVSRPLLTDQDFMMTYNIKRGCLNGALFAKDKETLEAVRDHMNTYFGIQSKHLPDGSTSFRADLRRIGMMFSKSYHPES